MVKDAGAGELAGSLCADVHEIIRQAQRMPRPAVVTYTYAGQLPDHDLGKELLDSFDQMRQALVAAQACDLLPAGVFAAHRSGKGGVVAWLVLDPHDVAGSAQRAWEGLWRAYPQQFLMALPALARDVVPAQARWSSVPVTHSSARATGRTQGSGAAPRKRARQSGGGDVWGAWEGDDTHVWENWPGRT